MRTVSGRSAEEADAAGLPGRDERPTEGVGRVEKEVRSKGEMQPFVAGEGGDEGGGNDLGRSVIEALRQFGSPSVPEPRGRIFTVTIIGQIEGHVQLPPQNKTTKYEHLIPQFVAAEQNPQIEGILILLNTVGGDVEAGLAIAEMVASCGKPSVALVLGGGHSIGVPIAVAADYSFIAETATMTIHPIRLNGLIIGVPQTFEYIEKMHERIVRFVTRHSRISPEKFKELMFKTGELTTDVGTNLSGPEAVEVGLIDAVGGLKDALAKLDELIRQRKGGQEGRSEGGEGGAKGVGEDGRNA